MHFRAGTDCPPALRKAAAGLFDAGQDGMLPDDRFGELETFMAVASKSGHELRAYDDALDFVAGRRDAEQRAAKLDAIVPARRRRSQAAGAAEGAAVSLSGRGRAVCGARRPGADRRRHGPGQDDPGDRRDRDPGAAFRCLQRCWWSARPH